MERYAAMQPPPPPSPPRNPGHEHRKHQQQTPARPCKKRGRKPGIHSSAVQRNAANARERSRMRVLSTAFANLKSVLPWVPRDTKLSKLDTLKLASGYIAYLKSKLDDPGDQDTSSSVFPPPISKDPIFGALTKGSTARLRIKHEDQSAMQTSVNKQLQVDYTYVDRQAVPIYPMEWVFNNESMEYLNHSSCTPFFSHTACETAASTTNSLVVSGSQSVPSSSIPTPSQLIDDNLPTIVFQRPFFQ